MPQLTQSWQDQLRHGGRSVAAKSRSCNKRPGWIRPSRAAPALQTMQYPSATIPWNSGARNANGH